MTLEQLRIFATVAEREHVSRAAEALGLTQSAVSGAVQSLERRHNIALFHRVGRRIELTGDGRIFLEQARAVLQAARAAEFALHELHGLKRGVINLFASQTTGAYWLPERLARFNARYPNIKINLSIGNTDQVAAAVSDGRGELGFVEGTIDRPDLATEPVDLDKLVIVTSPTHQWSGAGRITMRQLTQTKWVMREKGSGTRSVFEQALVRSGMSPDKLTIALELPSNEAVRAAVEAGIGATAISQAVVKSALAAGTLHAVNIKPLQRPFVLLRHRERRPSNAVRVFVAMLGK